MPPRGFAFSRQGFGESVGVLESLSRFVHTVPAGSYASQLEDIDRMIQFTRNTPVVAGRNEQTLKLGFPSWSSS